MTDMPEDTTLRDRIALAALAAQIANPAATIDYKNDQAIFDLFAQDAYRMADAMLKARSK